MEALKARPYFLKIVRWSTTAIFHFLTLLAVALIWHALESTASIYWNQVQLATTLVSFNTFAYYHGLPSLHIVKHPVKRASCSPRDGELCVRKLAPNVRSSPYGIRLHATFEIC